MEKREAVPFSDAKEVNLEENVVKAEISWPSPKAYPEGSLVYAILLQIGNNYQVVKIGATKDIYGRLANYGQAFQMEPRLRFTFHRVPPEFKKSMQDLFEKHYRDRSNDINWLEYRIERKLLDEYEERHGVRPPANRRKGSERKYLDRILLIEKGTWKILDFEPATSLDEILLRKLK